MPGACLDPRTDIVNDGEYGHSMGERYDYGAWWSYVFPRLDGLEITDVALLSAPQARPSRTRWRWPASSSAATGATSPISRRIEAGLMLQRDDDRHRPTTDRPSGYAPSSSSESSSHLDSSSSRSVLSVVCSPESSCRRTASVAAAVIAVCSSAPRRSARSSSRSI